MDRVLTMTNIKGETFRVIRALDDSTWWIYHDSYHNAPWTRKKFGL